MGGPNLRARLLKLRLAGVNTPFKKNEINREVAKDTAGNNYEQDVLDSLTDIISKSGGGHDSDLVRRKLNKGIKKLRKGPGGTSFDITL